MMLCDGQMRSVYSVCGVLQLVESATYRNKFISCSFLMKKKIEKHLRVYGSDLFAVLGSHNQDCGCVLLTVVERV